MVIFYSYVNLPEGNWWGSGWFSYILTCHRTEGRSSIYQRFRLGENPLGAGTWVNWRFWQCLGYPPKWAILGNSPWELNGIIGIHFLTVKFTGDLKGQPRRLTYPTKLIYLRCSYVSVFLGATATNKFHYGIETIGYPPWTTVCLLVHPIMRERNRLTIDHGYLGPHFFKVPESNYLDLHILGMSEVHRTQWIQWGYCNWNQFMYSFKTQTPANWWSFSEAPGPSVFQDSPELVHELAHDLGARAPEFCGHWNGGWKNQRVVWVCALWNAMVHHVTIYWTLGSSFVISRVLDMSTDLDLWTLRAWLMR